MANGARNARRTIRDTRQERTAIEAVARLFSATCEEGGDPPGAFLMVAGKRVAVDIRTFTRRGAGHANAVKPRLRFDKVVIRLLGRLQATLAETVPDGTTVVLTITAPIRLASKTAAALEDKIQSLLARRLPARDVNDTIHGNLVRIRLFRNGPEQAPKVIGFVHNSDSDPLLLLDMTSDLMEVVGAEAGKPAGDRWLVLLTSVGISCLETYRHVYSQLRIATGYQKILLVFDDGCVGILRESR